MSIVKSYSFPKGDIRGDMFYIKHNSNNFTVIDCYLKDMPGEFPRKELIVKEIIRESIDRVCRFISTHPDNDHIAGIDYLDDNWKITNFYAVKNNRPNDENDSSLTRYKKLLNEHNFPIERGLKHPWLNVGNEENGSCGISFHWPDLSNERFKQTLNLVSENKEINNICPIFTYQENSGATYMWMGDLEPDMQQEYYNKYSSCIPEVDILFHPHHGRESGEVPNELLKALNPKLIIIGNAPSRYLSYGDSYSTITQNTSGDIRFENENNEVHIYTRNNINNVPKVLRIKQDKRDILETIFLKWFYIGTLTINH